MKKLALAVAVPLALIGAATFYTSTQVEPIARNAVDEANVKLRELSVGAGADVSITMLSFDGGLLASDARYQVDIAVPDEDGGTRQYALLVQDRIEHGPFPLSRVTRGRLMPVAAQSHFQLERSPLTEKLFDAASGQSPLAGEVAIGYDGGQHGELRSVALNLEDTDGSVRVSPATIAFEATKNATAVRLDGELPDIDLNLLGAEGKPVRMSVRGVGMTADKKQDDNGFALGPSGLAVKRMEIQVGDEPAVVIQNATVDERLSQGSQGIDQTVAYRVGQLDAQGQTFSNLALAFSLRHLEQTSLKALLDSYKAVLASDADPEAALANMTSEQLGDLEAKGMQLLAQKPTLALDEFGFETAHGAARLSVVIDLNSPSTDAFTPDAMIASMLGSLKAEAGVDKGLVRDLTGLMAQRELDGADTDPVALQQQADASAELFSAMAIDTGWFQLQGDRLASSLHYADDKVTLNGRAMSVQEFIGFAFGSVQGAGLLGR
ncbi:YdgA family protein [Stutzerimonas marianensis]